MGYYSGSFRNQNRSQKNTITTNSVYSHSGIVPIERACTITFVTESVVKTIQGRADI